jgi:hypothetical protein
MSLPLAHMICLQRERAVSSCSHQMVNRTIHDAHIPPVAPLRTVAIIEQILFEVIQLDERVENDSNQCRLHEKGQKPSEQ